MGDRFDAISETMPVNSPNLQKSPAKRSGLQPHVAVPFIWRGIVTIATVMAWVTASIIPQSIGEDPERSLHAPSRVGCNGPCFIG
jgi:hypothetical protein